MSQTLQSVSDFVQQKQSVATSGDDSLKKAFDLSLANFLQAKLLQGNLVFCPLSGKILPRSEVITGAYIYWVSKGGTKSVACVENGERKVWLFFEQPRVVSRFKAKSKREFDQWVATGGLHNRHQWWGPLDAHPIPHEFTVVRLVDSQLEVFTHLYNRWAKLKQLCDPGWFDPRDMRRGTIFEQLTDLSDSRFVRPRMKEGKLLLDHFGLPEPFDYWRFGGADGHRSRCRDSPFYAQCHWL